MTVAEVPVAVDAAPPDVAGDTGGERFKASSLLAVLPVLALILVPVAVFAGGALIVGHPLLSGDNLIQSYPLRVLVGRDIAEGVWPTWDPWIWSGTPLMAGLNAGAFYPTTLLFAVLNPAGAWIVGQVFVSSSVGVGMYLFLRVTGTSPWASFLGALTLSFGGAIASQGVVHLDMGEGFASLPWMLLSVRRILDGGPWRWSLLLALAFTLLVLSGSPEAMLDVTILSAVYGVVRLSLHPAHWVSKLTRVAAGSAVGVGASALVWLPALHFIAISQRANAGSTFVGSYSYPPRELVLGLVPFLEGGFGLFSQPPYFGMSNLPEVAFYVGLLPAIASIALLAPKWKGWLPRGERLTWYVVIGLGLLLAIGAGTPLEHLIVHIPFYGKQRDQGRNIVDVDVGASVLLAWWLDGGRRPTGARSRSELVAVAALLGIIGAVVIWLTVSPSSLWEDLGTFRPPRAALDGIGEAVALTGALMLVAGAIVLSRRRLSPGLWRGITTAFVLADLALFTCSTGLAFTQASPSPSNPGALAKLVAANLSPGGRYAIANPDLYDAAEGVESGEPNLGILTGLPSVEGYGAIVDATYASDTGTHDRTALATGNLAAFRPLDLQVMLAPAEEFLTPIAGMPAPGSGTAIQPLVEAAGVDPLLPAGNVPVPEELLPPTVTAAPREAMNVSDRTGWFFGTELSPTTAELLLSHPAQAQEVRVGEITPAGSVAWQPAQRLAGPIATAGSQTVAIRLPAVRSAGLIVQLLKGTSLGPLQLAVQADGRAYDVNGPLETELTPLAWTSVGEADDFAVYRTDEVPAQAWAQPIGSGSQATRLPAAISVLAQSQDSATIEVRTAVPAVLVRSMAWDPGWNAQIVSGPSAAADIGEGTAGGDALAGSKPAAVRRLGLVQAVAVTAGVSVVRFSYEPKGFSTGLALTTATLAASVFAILAFAVLRHRRRSPARDLGS